MANNIIKYNSRITLKYDTLSNWRPGGTWINFTPLKGEVCIIDPTEDLGPDAACLIKIGNGKDSIGTLNYLSATAADVYDWAKLSVENIVTLLDTGEFGNIKLTQSFATDKELDDAISDLEEAIKGIDTLGGSLTGHETIKTNEKSQKNTFISHIAYDAEKNEATPYYTSVQFPTVDTSLNKDSSYAIANKAVYNETQTIRGLISAIDSDITNIENKIERAMHFIGVDRSADGLKDGEGGIPKIDGFEGYTPAAGDVVMSKGHEFIYTVSGVWERLGQDSEFMLANHKITKDNIAENAGIEQTMIVSALNQTNLKGDIDDLDTRVKANAKAIADHASEVTEYKFFSMVSGNTGGTVTADGRNDTLSIVGDGKIKTTVSEENNLEKVSISHEAPGENSPRGDKDGTSNDAPDHGETFTVIDEVSSDSTGHVIGVNVKTITLPPAYNDNEIRSAIKILQDNTWKTATRNKVTQVDDNTNGNFTTGLQDSEGNSTLNKSDLTIGTDVIGYIIWDCGSASKNI